MLQMIHTDGVEAYEGSVRYVRAVRGAGLPRAVVWSTPIAVMCWWRPGLRICSTRASTGLSPCVSICGANPHRTRPFAGACALGVEPSQAAMFEDALAGVEAGRAGGFGFVVGVDRVGQADALRQHGADVVVTDLSELLEHR